MTPRPQLDERDPLPEPDWQPTSSAWARRQALEAAAAAVTAAKEARKKPGFDVGPDEGMEFVEFVDYHENDELSW